MKGDINMIKAVVFDVFETLVTFLGSNHYGSESMAEDAGVPIPDFQRAWWVHEYDRSVGNMTTDEALAETLRTLGVYSDELLKRMMKSRRDSKERVFSEKYMHPDVIPMFRALKERGLKVALISNCFSEEAEQIRNSDFFEYIDVPILSYEQGVCKPDKAIYERCVQELGVAMNECLYLGDGGSRELETAGEVGMHPVQAAWYLVKGGDQPCYRKPGFRQADNPMDVLRFVDEGDRIRYCKWYGEVAEDDFISTTPSYEVGKFFSRFHEGSFAAEGMTMKFYWHDPREYGYADDGKLPLLCFLHGTSNALVGDVCINYTGAEMYASDEYQKTMGGAFILIPVANEYRSESGRVEGTWKEKEYLPVVHELILDFIANRTNGVGKRFLFGNSSGATFVLRLMDNYMDDFDVVAPVGSTALPDDSVLDQYDAKERTLFFAMGRRDEFHDYEKEVVPRLPRLQSMKHCFLCIPDWVRNGDGGIASIGADTFEMGQHCMMNSMQSNMMFADGTPMDPRLPKGVTGWIAEVK